MSFALLALFSMLLLVLLLLMISILIVGIFIRIDERDADFIAIKLVDCRYLINFYKKTSKIEIPCLGLICLIRKCLAKMIQLSPKHRFKYLRKICNED